MVDKLFALARAEVDLLALRRVSLDLGKLVLHVVAVITPLAWRMHRVEIVRA